MPGGRKWRTIVRLILASGVIAAAWGGLGLLWLLTREEVYQRRLAVWGGRSLELPADTHPFFRFRHQIRRYAGERFYRTLTGSSGRVVSYGEERGKPADGRPDATPAQLAELLEIQPIKAARMAGAKHLGDDWLVGIRNPELMTSLELGGSAITDRSAEFIVRMKNLRALGLVDTAISDAEVFRICRLPNLESFEVGGPNIRSIRLVDHRLLDESGAPAFIANGKLRLEGLVETVGLPGATHNVRVLIRREGDPTGSVDDPEQELSSIELESPRSWRFQVALAEVPSGRSIIEVWIDHQPGFTTPVVHYRLPPFPIDLAAPEESDGHPAREPDQTSGKSSEPTVRLG